MKRFLLSSKKQTFKVWTTSLDQTVNFNFDKNVGNK